jgi:hypothetical protein
LEALELPRRVFRALLLKDLPGLVVDVDRLAGSRHGSTISLIIPVSIMKWYEIEIPSLIGWS